MVIVGLYLVLEVIGLGFGDEVIMIIYIFMVMVEVVCYFGVDVKLVDIDFVMLNIDIGVIEVVIML